MQRLLSSLPASSRAEREQRLHSQAPETSLRRRSCTAQTKPPGGSLNTSTPLHFFKSKAFLPNCAPDFFLFSSSFAVRFPVSLHRKGLCWFWCHPPASAALSFQQPQVPAHSIQPGEDPEPFPGDLQREHGGGWQHEALE